MFSFLNPWHASNSVHEGIENPWHRESIEIKQTPHSIVISNPFGRENWCPSRKWDRFIEEMFVNVMVGKNGCLFTIDVMSFSIEMLKSEVVVEVKGPDNRRTLIFYKDCWTREDIQIITDTCSVDLDTIRMAPDCNLPKALKMFPAYISILWQSHDHHGNMLKFPHRMELIGCFADGEYAFWLNYPTKKTKMFHKSLNVLATQLRVSVDKV